MSLEDDKRLKNRFGWVKRLMQGQNGKGNHVTPAATTNSTSARREARARNGQDRRQQSIRFSSRDDRELNDLDSKVMYAENSLNGVEWVNADDQSMAASINSDGLTTASYMDNVSTIPLKSIGSTPSTHSPSLLSDMHNDLASTTETSITPTIMYPHHSRTHSHHSNGGGANSNIASGTSNGSINYANSTLSAIPPNLMSADRDSESIVTLASSSRRVRRKSLDTNCSTTGIPPASIMEKLSVNPGAGNSLYAVSMTDRGSVYNNERSSINERGSVYNNERGSINERGSLYNNERGSINERGSYNERSNYANEANEASD